MNIQAETNQDDDRGLVYNHDEARVLATAVTTFNNHMECTEVAKMEHNEVMSPTTSKEGTLLTAVIKAQEGQDITTCDIQNAFVQTHV